MVPSLLDSSITFELRRHLHSALLCIEESTSNRPSMSDVISMLRNEVVTLHVAMKPTFLIRRASLEQQFENSKQEGFLTNYASVSLLKA